MRSLSFPGPLAAHFRGAAFGLALAAMASLPPTASAQEFALYVSPPRLEADAKAGETRRLVLELQHVGRETGRFRLYTNDWALKDDGTVEFADALGPGSCRPWVALERRELTIPSNGRYRFRLEISPPAGTAPTECRFALMIEGLDATQVAQGSFTFPVTGRIGVIVYARVGEVAAKLSIARPRVVDSPAGRLPAVEVTNAGDATGRLEGFLTGKDAGGREFELAPDPAPILPGSSRTIRLVPTTEDGKAAPAIRYPLTVKGNVEWGKSRQPLDLRFEP